MTIPRSVESSWIEPEEIGREVGPRNPIVQEVRRESFGQEEAKSLRLVD
jgi:hypothetical protein